MRPLWSGTWCLAAALSLPAAALKSARADYDETEIRLKAANVDPPLRKRIHDAIARGVTYLLAQQGEDGRWDGKSRYGPQLLEFGTTALCALALRHAGLPPAKAGATRALDALLPAPPPPGPVRESGGRPVPDDRRSRFTFDTGDVYNAGILLMLLMVDGRRPSFGQGIADALAVSIDPQTGWWSYEADADPNVGLAARITINLSTSQFAALGLWAATRLGLRLDPSVWSKHAEGLCRAQKRSGSWAYSPWLEAGTMGNTDGYPTGTFMGCANLALARRRGESRIDPKSPLGLRVDAAWESALGALNRDAKVFLSTTGKTPPEWQLARRDGFSYYTLYALEKACIFADLEKIGGVSWYRTGAETLLRFQSKDGSWSYEGGEDPIVSTAFALLFLLRSSQSYHPVTPRDVDANPAAPTTPREPAMSGDGPVPEGGDRPTPPK